MVEMREGRVNKWIEDVSRNVALHAGDVATADTPEQQSTGQGNWHPAGEEVSVDSEEQRWVGQVNSLAFGKDVEVREPPGGMKKLIDMMIAQTEEIRMLKKGDMMLGEAASMVNRPFDNPENDFHVSNKLGVDEVNTRIEGFLIPDSAGV